MARFFLDGDTTEPGHAIVQDVSPPVDLSRLIGPHMSWVQDFYEGIQREMVSSGLIEKPTPPRTQAAKLNSCYVRLRDANHCGASSYEIGGRGQKPGAWEYDPARPGKPLPTDSTFRIRLRRAREMTRRSGYLSLLS